jgi:hypothetical protein
MKGSDSLAAAALARFCLTAGAVAATSRWRKAQWR